MAEIVTAVAIAAGLVGSAGLWTVRQIVRGEVEPIKQDIAVLRGAVFNHLAHGERPEEDTIRERLGYGRR